MVGAVSRLSPEKGFDHLLRAVALLRDRGVDGRRRAGGRWAVARALERLTEELGLRDRVEFMGEVRARDVPAVLRGSTSSRCRRRGRGSACRRSRRARWSCRSWRRTSTASRTWCATARRGCCVPPADAGALADAIGRLAGDAELRRAMGNAGRAFVERRLRWQDNARLMEVLYGDMVAGGEAGV